MPEEEPNLQSLPRGMNFSKELFFLDKGELVVEASCLQFPVAMRDWPPEIMIDDVRYSAVRAGRDEQRYLPTDTTGPAVVVYND